MQRGPSSEARTSTPKAVGDAGSSERARRSSISEIGERICVQSLAVHPHFFHFNMGALCPLRMRFVMVLASAHRGHCVTTP